MIYIEFKGPALNRFLKKARCAKALARAIRGLTNLIRQQDPEVKIDCKITVVGNAEKTT